MNMMGSMMGGMETLSDAERQILLGYLSRNAQEAVDPARYPDLASSEGEAFQKTCQTCHALPDPKQHTSAEGSSVVARMQGNMSHMGVERPSEAEINAVLSFLQEHSKTEKE